MEKYELEFIIQILFQNTKLQILICSFPSLYWVYEHYQSYFQYFPHKNQPYLLVFTTWKTKKYQ